MNIPIKNIEVVIKHLQHTFPDIHGIHDAHEWDASIPEGTIIHLGDAVEGGEIDGMPACDYYSFENDPEEKLYILGAHKRLIDELDKFGLFMEFQNPGTAFVVPVWPEENEADIK